MVSRPRINLISIHAPRGGSDSCQSRLDKVGRISIHAPRGGSDRHGGKGCHHHEISIHAPRGGSDQLPAAEHPATGDFNPRSPWGERQQRCTNFLFIFGESKQFLQYSSRETMSTTSDEGSVSVVYPLKAGANILGISAHYSFALQDQSILRQIGVLAAEMLDLFFVLIPQIVETEAVLFRVHDRYQLCL